MAEPFLLAAWVTGILEGGSVLKEHARNNKNDVPSISLLVPSLLYGTFAMPMSLIGESPGPALISLFPMAPKIAIPEDRRQPPPMQGEHSADATTSSSSSSSNVSMIELARKENRMIMAQRRRPLASFPRWSHYFATLQQQRLPTPMAESMRRLRFLVLGAGLVSWYYNLQKRAQPSEASTRSIMSKSEQASSLDSLVQSANRSNPGGGVVLRLVATAQNTHVPGRLPVLCLGKNDYNTTIGAPQQQLQLQDKDSFSALQDWLVHTTSKDRNNSFLLVEANITLPLAQCFRPSSTDTTTTWMDRVLFATRRISALAAGQEEESAANVVTVWIGSGRKDVVDLDTTTPNNTTIYVDALSEVARTVRFMVDELSATSDTSEEETIDTPEESKETAILDGAKVVEEAAPSTDIFASIGVLIRHGIQYSSKFLTKLFIPREKRPRVLHLVSDNPNFIDWACTILGGRSGYQIVWVNPLNQHEMEANYLRGDGSLSLICCRSDEQTSNALQTIVSRGGTNDTQVVALLDQAWMQTATEEILQPIPPGVKIVSTETLHKHTFDRIQALLAEGHSPDEIQNLEELLLNPK
jgi:hypothetical protein